ncbi:MAG TPA: HEAT repeat domain-containing protein [Polyangia bacterium]|nr:HEAT repeat domain-containing protein [Polyangia bacterium]
MYTDAALRDLEHRDPRVRAQAADALGRVADGEIPVALAALQRAVNDAHPSVRYAALLSLGELGAAGGAGSIIAHLDDDEPLCREAAAIALGQLGAGGGEPAWVALTLALSSPAPEVRFQAIASLAEIDAARAATVILPALDDRDHKVRAQAAAALGDSGERVHTDRLARLLDDTDDVRHEAALALARLGDRRGLPSLVRALADRNRALDAATALAKIGIGGDAAATAALGQAVERWLGDPLVKVRAAEALARAGDERGMAHLRRAARASRDDVRGLAESVLSDLQHAAH